LGVYRGGTTILMAKMLKTLNIINKKILACDTFSGFPDGDKESTEKNLSDFMDNNPDILKKKLVKYGLENYVDLVIGKFDDTLHTLPSKNMYGIAFVDCDLYKSAKVALEHLKSRMIKNGFIFIHDYNNKKWAIRKAVDEFDYNPNEIMVITTIESYKTPKEVN